MADPTPATAGRLRELARLGAEHNHCFKSGHDKSGPMEACPHPDCVLVRLAASEGQREPIADPSALRAEIAEAREACPCVRQDRFADAPLLTLVREEVSRSFRLQARAERAEAELAALRAGKNDDMDTVTFTLRVREHGEILAAFVDQLAQNGYRLLPPVETGETPPIIDDIVSHWFIQGGEWQFGALGAPGNADELVAAILHVVRARLSSPAERP